MAHCGAPKACAVSFDESKLRICAGACFPRFLFQIDLLEGYDWYCDKLNVLKYFKSCLNKNPTL